MGCMQSESACLQQCMIIFYHSGPRESRRRPGENLDVDDISRTVARQRERSNRREHGQHERCSEYSKRQEIRARSISRERGEGPQSGQSKTYAREEVTYNRPEDDIRYTKEWRRFERTKMQSEWRPSKDRRSKPVFHSLKSMRIAAKLLRLTR